MSSGHATGRAPASAPANRRRLPMWRRVLFALLPATALLLVAEITIRLVRAPLHFGSFRQLRTDMLKRNYPATLDAVLGYVPTPSCVSTDNHWGTRVSIDADGLRQNGDGPPPDEDDGIVAVGDSFTFGDQVDDDQTWPALLERELGRGVRNGGVFGYSFAQTVLRGEALVERMQPGTLIVSFIPDDLRRCTYSRRYTPVPWFDLVDGELALRGVPIDHAAGADDPSKRWKDTLGHVALLDAVFAHTSPAWWFEDEKQIPIDHLWAHTVELGQKLVERIATTCRTRDVRLLVVLQSESTNPEALAVMRHADAIGVRTLDLASRFLELVEHEPARRREWFDGHMTPAGNAWVAGEIAAVLRAWR